MMEQNLEETKRKILSLLKIKGPSLPVHISREVNLDMLFSAAILSELASEKLVKISKMKVGGSPLYFLEGQEQQLEKFSNYLPNKEKEAFLLLKQKKLLQDKKQEPAIRVALRNLKDFAFPLIINISNRQELFWRFYTMTEKEAREKLQRAEIIKTKERTQIKAETIERPLLTLKPKSKSRKEKSDFVKSVISKLQSESIEILEEKDVKKREYQAIIKINSDIGKLFFLLIAKDKKRITENDLTLAIQKAQTLKMPALLLTPGQLNKKALTYLEQYSGLLKFKKI